MKSALYITVLCCVSVMSACGGNGGTADTEPVAVNSEIVLSVEGMHCTDCAQLIDISLEKLTGISSASVSFDSARAVVLYDSLRISQDEIVSAASYAGNSAPVYSISVASSKN